MLILGVMSCLSSCGAVHVNKPALCRIPFDYADPAVENLSITNLRALAAWKESCQIKNIKRQQTNKN